MANGDVKTEEITATIQKDEKSEETNKEESKAVEKKPITKEVEAQIVRQIEYYFGDINLPRDKFLKEQIELDDGWVPLSVLLTFNRLAALTTDEEVIADTLLNSETNLIRVSDDRKKIRRNPDLPIPELNDERKKELMTRTAYAKGFPLDHKLESILKYFEDSEYAHESVHMRHHFDKATKEYHFKGSIFVIFKDIDTCKKFIEAEEIKYNDKPLIRKWQADYLEEKKKEREERNSKRKNKKDKQTENDEPKHKFPKGTILFMEGFTKDDTSREAIKSKVNEIVGKEPAFVTFEKGQKEGYIRFSDENGAVDFASKLTDNKVEIDGNDITIRVLEGEEEEQFLTNLSQTLEKIRQNNKGNKNKGRKRKGGYHDGPRSKQNRK